MVVRLFLKKEEFTLLVQALEGMHRVPLGPMARLWFISRNTYLSFAPTNSGMQEDPNSSSCSLLEIRVLKSQKRAFCHPQLWRAWTKLPQWSPSALSTRLEIKGRHTHPPSLLEQDGSGKDSQHLNSSLWMFSRVIFSKILCSWSFYSFNTSTKFKTHLTVQITFKMSWSVSHVETWHLLFLDVPADPPLLTSYDPRGRGPRREIITVFILDWI